MILFIMVRYSTPKIICLAKCMMSNWPIPNDDSNCKNGDDIPPPMHDYHGKTIIFIDTSANLMEKLLLHKLCFAMVYYWQPRLSNVVENPQSKTLKDGQFYVH